MAPDKITDITLPDPLNEALIDALHWARREGRPISVWMHRDRFSLRVQHLACPGPSWILIATIKPDDQTTEVLVDR